MLKQKTVAKWLAIVLLMTIAIGSYLLYDAVFKNSGGTADAVDDTDNVVSEGDEPKIETPIHVPFYTTLPRASEKINGVTVAHVGGEGDDEIVGAINYAGKKYVFFETDSVEYDVKENGLHLAYFNDDELIFVDKISDGKFLDAKLCSKGVALSYATDEETVLDIIGNDGNVIASTKISDADDFKFYLHGDTLVSFKIENGTLRFSEYLDDVKEQLSPYVTKTKGAHIDEVLYTGGKFLVVTSSDDGTYGYTYSQNLGFNIAFSYDKLSFEQLLSVGNENDSNLVLLLKSVSDGLILSTLSSNFSIASVKTVGEINSGVLVGNGDGFDLVGSGKTLTYCKHLDLISTTENSLDFDKVLRFTPYKNSAILITQKGDFYALSSTAIGVISTLPYNVLSPIITPTSYGIEVICSSSSSSGIARASFGGKDVFLFGYTI